MRSLWMLAVIAAMPGAVEATLYDFNGTWIEVDYWAEDGSADPVNETIVVIDWNDTHGPYATESHAWGYRWTGAGTALDALHAIDAAGVLALEFAFGGGFLSNASYQDLAIDADNHRTTDWPGWVWAASSDDGGQTWDPNAGALDAEELAHQRIEGLNWNPGDWTGENLTVPVPEPTVAVLLALGGLALLRRRCVTHRA